MYDILFFSAHPDDAEFAMGGTFIKLSRKFKCIHVLLTRGEAGTYGTPQQREIECTNAAKFAGADIEFLDFTDNHIEDNAANALKLASIIRKYKPKTVFTPYHTNISFHEDGLSHPDHTALGRLVFKAARYAKFKNSKATGEAHSVQRIIYYLLPQWLKPSFIVDVTDVMPDLENLWSMHTSQAAVKDGKIHDMLRVDRKYAGTMQNVAYAEKFVIESPIKMDIDFLDKI
jgi:LmbE family N-acetylglucosaminyl deacetylase